MRLIRSGNARAACSRWRQRRRIGLPEPEDCRVGQASCQPLRLAQHIEIERHRRAAGRPAHGARGARPGLVRRLLTASGAIRARRLVSTRTITRQNELTGGPRSRGGEEGDSGDQGEQRFQVRPRWQNFARGPLFCAAGAQRPIRSHPICAAVPARPSGDHFSPSSYTNDFKKAPRRPHCGRLRRLGIAEPVKLFPSVS